MHFYFQIMQKNVCKLAPKIYKRMQEMKYLKVNSYWGLLHVCVPLPPCCPQMESTPRKNGWCRS